MKTFNVFEMNKKILQIRGKIIAGHLYWTRRKLSRKLHVTAVFRIIFFNLRVDYFSETYNRRLWS